MKNKIIAWTLLIILLTITSPLILLGLILGISYHVIEASFSQGREHMSYIVNYIGSL